jgi:hypothetical protein
MEKRPLTIVPGLRSTLPEPPRKLGEPGLALWRAIHTDYRIEDVGSLELLTQICAALDRAERLAAVINGDGEMIRTKSGVKPHPCLPHELAARSFVCRTLARLGLTSEPIAPIGRPPRPVGWRPPDADE